MRRAVGSRLLLVARRGFCEALFYTEYPLFLATTGAFYFLVSSLESKSDAPRNWIGLGLSIGLGLLAKASFLLIAAPLLGFVLVAGRIRALIGPPPLFAVKAGALASLIAATLVVEESRAGDELRAELQVRLVRHPGPAIIAHLGTVVSSRSHRACWDMGWPS